MSRMFQYYGRLNGVRGSVLGLPPWARLIVIFAALPGLVVLALSALIFIVSLFALLLLVVPTYRVLRALVGESSAEGSAEADVPQGVNPADLLGAMCNQPTSRRVDARVVEALPHESDASAGAEALGPQ